MMLSRSDFAISCGSLLLIAVCQPIFFNPQLSLIHIDDLFFVPWAAELAQTGRHFNPLLRDQFPDFETLLLQTRLHMIAAAEYFNFAGVSRSSVVFYAYICYAVAALSFLFLSLSKGLKVAALFGPILLAVMYALGGFRLEMTGSAIWLLGVTMLFGPNLVMDAAERKNAALWSVFGKIILVLAPLAAPAALAWSLGAIVARDAFDFLEKRRKLSSILMEDIALIPVAILLLMLTIDFDFKEFWSQFFYHASRSDGRLINPEAFFRGVAIFGLGLFIGRRDRGVGKIILALALGQILASILHDKSVMRNVAATVVFLLAVDVLLTGKMKVLAWVTCAVAALFLSANFLLFYGLSERDETSYQAVRDHYSTDISSGKRVLIDEVMAHHFLDHQTRDATAWKWSKPFPLANPGSLNELGSNEVWYLSKYVLYSWMRRRSEVGNRLADDVAYAQAPHIGCWIGRSSCRYPQNGWQILRFERDDKTVSVTDYETGRIINVQLAGS